MFVSSRVIPAPRAEHEPILDQDTPTPPARLLPTSNYLGRCRTILWCTHRAFESINQSPQLGYRMDDWPRKGNDPPRKRQRRPIPSEQQEQLNEAKKKNITDLDDALLRSILDFLPGHFRFVASVNRRFRSLYDHQAPNTFYRTAMTSDATRAIWLEENTANVRDDGCRFAAKCGNLEVLQWLRSEDCRWDDRVCIEASGGGHLHILHWARSQTPPCPWDALACAYAAQNGHLDVLQWLRSQTPPCPWDAWACAYAAQNGRLDMLQWMRSQTTPCPWDKWACAYAAFNDRLDVLQWLRVQTPPCPWDEWACSYAAASGHLEVLQWLRSQTPPCPWNIRDCLVFAENGSEMELFLRSHL